MSELPPRGTGLILGTARRGLARGLGRPLTEEERARRHKAIFGYVASSNGIAVLDLWRQNLENRGVVGTIFEFVNLALKRELPIQKTIRRVIGFPSGQISVDTSEFRGYTYTSSSNRISITRD